MNRRQRRAHNRNHPATPPVLPMAVDYRCLDCISDTGAPVLIDPTGRGVWLLSWQFRADSIPAALHGPKSESNCRNNVTETITGIIILSELLKELGASR